MRSLEWEAQKQGQRKMVTYQTRAKWKSPTKKREKHGIKTKTSWPGQGFFQNVSPATRSTRVTHFANIVKSTIYSLAELFPEIPPSWRNFSAKTAPPNWKLLVFSFEIYLQNEEPHRIWAGFVAGPRIACVALSLFYDGNTLEMEFQGINYAYCGFRL